jgi:putative Mg2+ transporter-C (MgtC) family protein
LNEFGLSDEAAVRLVAALLFGAVVGFERELSDQPAGLRTHIAVAVGACLFGVISTLGFDEFLARRETTNVQVDVTRVASQVVVGIGFLGAGLIFRQGGMVRNLTTAASLWTVSAVGLACGVGDLGVAGLTTALMVVALALLRPLRTWLDQRFARDDCTIAVTLAPGVEPDEIVTALEDTEGISVLSLALGKDDGRYVIDARLESDPGRSTDPAINDLARRPEVQTLTRT